jgi:hypothetical protein
MIYRLLFLLLLSGCVCASPPAPPAVTTPAPAPTPETPPPAKPSSSSATQLPAILRAALVRAKPREAEMVATLTDGAEIALVRQLDEAVRDSLIELERDESRHMTPAVISRARTAMRDLENHLKEFQTKQDAQ